MSASFPFESFQANSFQFDGLQFGANKASTMGTGGAPAGGGGSSVNTAANQGLIFLMVSADDDAQQFDAGAIELAGGNLLWSVDGHMLYAVTAQEYAVIA